jgi:outer membrane protein assembly factor BamB
MRARTLAVVGVVAVVVVALAGVVVLGLGSSGTGGDLTERWVSDTPRDNERNHHAVGAGADGRVVVAPVAEIPGAGSLTDTSCTLARLDADDGAVLWRTTLPPDRCFTHALTEPAVADLDGDGEPTVLAATVENALVARNATDGSERWRVPLRPGGGTPERPVYGYGRPTVADLPVSPDREVVVSSIQGDVAVVTANGTVAWRASLSNATGTEGTVPSRPLVVDADGDGDREVVVGSYDALAVFEADGGVAWTRATPAAYLVATDADADPARELLVAEGGTLRAVDGATGETQWTREFDTSLRFREVADVDGDGTDELSVGTFDGDALAVDVRTGETDWRVSVSGDGAPVWSPVTADLGGDSPDVVTTSRDGTVTVLDGAGGDALATYERSVPVETHVTPVDLDGDGVDDLLVRYGDGRVVALDYGD